MPFLLYEQYTENYYKLIIKLDKIYWLDVSERNIYLYVLQELKKDPTQDPKELEANWKNNPVQGYTPLVHIEGLLSELDEKIIVQVCRERQELRLVFPLSMVKL